MANQQDTRDIISFSHKDVVTALLKAKGIHTGIWMLSIEFGFAVANFPIQDVMTVPVTDPLDALQPTAMVPLKHIGIRPAAEVNNLTVDAAKVNPKPPKKK